MATILHRMSLSVAVLSGRGYDCLFVLKRGIKLAIGLVLRLFSTLLIDLT